MDKSFLMYLIAWLGPNIPTGWRKGPEFDALLAENCVEMTPKGPVATQKGRDSLSPMARKACNRPTNYDKLSGQAQWDVDKSLGILDWDGT